jgi:hypothetical protein
MIVQVDNFPRQNGRLRRDNRLATILPETVAQEQRDLCVVRLPPAIDPRRVALLGV